jgi:hypothetical protein
LKLDFALCEEQNANWNPLIKRKAFFAEGSTQTFSKYLIIEPKERPEINQGSHSSQVFFISAPVSQVTAGIWQIF